MRIRRLKSNSSDRLVEAYATAANSKPDGPSLAVGTVGRDPVHELAEIGQRWSKTDTSNGHEIVAAAHCFVLPDGELGASGLPDPKAVLFEGQWLMAEP